MTRVLRFGGRFRKDFKNLEPETQRRILTALTGFVATGQVTSGPSMVGQRTAV